jgi:hypothetical protein
MGQLSPLAEYILAYTLPDGGKLARYGVVQYYIPVLPPGTEVAFDIYPWFNSYCCIAVRTQMSPSVQPGTINFRTSHEGVIVTSGPIGTLATSESHDIWLEITRTAPVRTIVSNISNLNVFFEAVDIYLVVQAEDDLKAIRELIARYGNMEKVR